MSRLRVTFFVGMLGGLIGYACGTAFTPRAASAQQGGSQQAADAGTGDAGVPPTTTTPAPTASACQQWEVKLGPNLYQTGVVMQIEEGWEPFARADGYVTLRRCVR